MGKATGSAGTASPHHPPTDHERNYAQIAYEFAQEAARDRYGRKHNRFIRLAAKRHLQDLKKARRKGYPFEFSAWHANDICDFAEAFPHVEGEWDTESIKLEPAQIFILCSVFGWRNKATGKRRFALVYIEMARKGAKSTLTAVVAHYCLTCDQELGPQIIIGATTRAQADKVFKPAKEMAKRTPDYRDAFGIDVFTGSILCADNGGFIQPINAKSSTQDGWNPHVGILDELHAHKDRGVYDVIRSAFGARKNALMWIITTAGYFIEGVCYETRTIVTKVLEGTLEADHIFGAIFTLDKGDDPLDETKWIKANPLLGVTPSVESMRGYAAEARAAPGAMAEFKTKRCNVWTSSKDGWLAVDELWPRCDGTKIDFRDLRGIPCYGGLDLASTTDIAAFVLVWLIEGRLVFRGRYWLPEETVYPRTERGNVPYQTWVKQGWLTTTPGEVTDYDYIERDILDVCDEFGVQQIGFDRRFATQIVNNLQTQLGEDMMVQLAQGPITYNPAMREFERLFKKKVICHGGDPVMRWMASNIVKRTDVNDNWAPDRKNSHEKIDGMVALLMALERAICGEGGPSVYEERGLSEADLVDV